jgi:hypothetical protein
MTTLFAVMSRRALTRGTASHGPVHRIRTVLWQPGFRTLAVEEHLSVRLPAQKRWSQLADVLIGQDTGAPRAVETGASHPGALVVAVHEGSRCWMRLGAGGTVLALEAAGAGDLRDQGDQGGPWDLWDSWDRWNPGDPRHRRDRRGPPGHRPPPGPGAWDRWDRWDPGDPGESWGTLASVAHAWLVAGLPAAEFGSVTLAVRTMDSGVGLAVVQPPEPVPRGLRLTGM